MPNNERIKWFHNKIVNNHFPNAFRISEKFNISRSKAARDVTFLRERIKAPLLYDKSKKGYYYSGDFSLPQSISTSDSYDYISELSSIIESKSNNKSNINVQMQIPYTATIELQDKLAILELKDFIKEKTNKNQYKCEIKNIDLFLCTVFALDSNITIVEPLWLREKLVNLAKRVISNNPDK